MTSAVQAPARPQMQSVVVVFLLALLFQVQGVIEAAGISTSIYRGGLLVASGAIIAASAPMLLQSISARISAVGLIALMIVSAASFLINRTPLMEFAMAGFRDLMAFGALLAFIAVGRRTSSRTFALTIAGFGLLYLTVSVIKLAVFGVDESYWIGTLSQTAGQYGVTYAAIFAPLVMAFSALWGIPLAALFGLTAVVHEKRAIIAVFPLLSFAALGLIIAASVFRSRRQSQKPKLGRLVGLVALNAAMVVLVLLVAVRGIPSLNPEERVWGTFDLGHVLSYVDEYSTRGYESELNNPIENVSEDQGIQIGRAALFPATFEWSSQRPWLNQVVGDGPGTVDTSPILGNRDDIFFEHTGLRGATSYFQPLLVERGWAGVLALFVPLLLLTGWHFIHIARSILVGNNPSLSRWTAFWASAVVVLDLALYSPVSLYVPAAMVILGLASGRAEREA